MTPTKPRLLDLFCGRSAFTKATGLTERRLEHIASGNALKYVELGGIPEQES